MTGQENKMNEEMITSKSVDENEKHRHEEETMRMGFVLAMRLLQSELPLDEEEQEAMDFFNRHGIGDYFSDGKEIKKEMNDNQ